MKTDDILKAWIRIREIDNTIPDDVLDFMKDSAIVSLSKTTPIQAESEDIYADIVESKKLYPQTKVKQLLKEQREICANEFFIWDKEVSGHATTMNPYYHGECMKKIKNAPEPKV